MSERTVIGETSRPELPRGVRLKYDKAREQWALLAPERMFVLDETALEIVRGCDGEADVAQIVDDLARRFKAPRDVVLADVVRLLQDFADKGIITA